MFDLARKIASLTQDTQKNKADIKELQNQMEELTEAVRQLPHEMQRDRENQAHELEKLLRLEVALLRSEQRRMTGRNETHLLLEEPDEPTLQRGKAEGCRHGWRRCLGNGSDGLGEASREHALRECHHIVRAGLGLVRGHAGRRA